MTEFLTVGDTVINKTKIISIIFEDRQAKVLLEGQTLVFDGEDARLLWDKLADDKGWRRDDEP